MFSAGCKHNIHLHHQILYVLLRFTEANCAGPAYKLNNMLKVDSFVQVQTAHQV